MRPLFLFAAAFVLLVIVSRGEPPGPAVGRLEVLDIPGLTLRGNPLHDPVERHVALYLPRAVKEGTAEALTVVYYLPGYGGSSEDFIALGETSAFAQIVQRFADEHHPLAIAVVDCRNRFGGSQYLNSPAQGNYEDYVTSEIVAAVEARYPVKDRAHRIVAGHSSGGYGTLILAMSHQNLFGAAVALAPDSDFEVTHRPIVEQANVRHVTQRDVETFTRAENPVSPPDDLVSLVCGLSAAYTPVGPAQPGHFRWLYDDTGAWQPQVWQQWLDHDPLLLMRKNDRAFAADQRIYLDGAAHDEWHFNVSARLMFDALKTRSAPVTFYEPPGGHGSHLAERLTRGLAWVFGLPVTDIPQ